MRKDVLCSRHSTGSQDYGHGSQLCQGQLRNFAAPASSIVNVIDDSLDLSEDIFSSFPKFQPKILKEHDKLNPAGRFASVKS